MRERAWRWREWLDTHPAVEKVIYPGLASHPQHELAKRQMDGFGGIISIVLKGGFEAAKTLLREAPSCSPWPNRWAAWKAWSTIRR